MPAQITVRKYKGKSWNAKSLRSTEVTVAGASVVGSAPQTLTPETASGFSCLSVMVDSRMQAPSVGS